MPTTRSCYDEAIKDVITAYPEVGTILAQYDVGCVTCQVGTCRLKDVVSIHGLSPEVEAQLMARIEQVVGGEAQAPTPPGSAAVTTAPAKQFTYSPPIKALVDEHVLIMRWVKLIPQVVAAIDLSAAKDQALLLAGVDFIRSYADKFHHAKEEDILFGYFDQTQGVIKAMLSDHEIARAHTREAAEAIEGQDHDAVARHFSAYGRLLTEHIIKEDTILYPWMDRELSTAQVGELFRRFAAVDEAAGPGFTPRYTAVVERIEAFVASGTSTDIEIISIGSEA
jgi:hemerythrin-like domain-containing protein